MAEVLRPRGDSYFDSSEQHNPMEKLTRTVLKMLPGEGTIFEIIDPKEYIRIEKIREIKEEDINHVMRWFQDEQTKRHLDPVPQSLEELTKYYLEQGQEGKITTLVAANFKDKPLGAVTIRWRGDPWVPESKHKRAGIERLVVNPRIRGRGVGTRLADEAEKMIFMDREYPEVRAWVMTDKIAADLSSFNFFRDRGYQAVQGERTHWREYAEKRNIPNATKERDAIWFSLKKEDWQERAKKKELETPNDKAINQSPGSGK